MRTSHWRIRYRKLVWIGAGVILLGGGAFAASYPAAPAVAAASAQIHGCYKIQNGQLRIVADAASCNPSEAHIVWNTEGPQGPVGPRGDVGPVGPQGATGDTGPVGPVGAVGPVGPVGPLGPVGPVGPVGPEGAKGDRGEAGPPGEPAATPEPMLVVDPPGARGGLIAEIPGVQGPLVHGGFDAGFAQAITRRGDGTLAWSTAISLEASAELRARAASGTPLATGSQVVHLRFVDNVAHGGGIGSVFLEADLHDVLVTRLVPGTDNGLPLFDVLYLEFSRIDWTLDNQEWSFDLETQTLTPHASPGTSNHSLDFGVRAGVPQLEPASSFSSPAETPGFLGAGSVVVEDGDHPNNHRLSRFVALVTGAAIPAADVRAGLSGGNPRRYQMTNLHVTSIVYSGVSETVGFTAETMRWTLDGDSAEFP
jgi:hypothetical protein